MVLNVNYTIPGGIVEIHMTPLIESVSTLKKFTFSNILINNSNMVCRNLNSVSITFYWFDGSGAFRTKYEIIN